MSTEADSLKCFLLKMWGEGLCCPHLTLYPPKISQPVPLWVGFCSNGEESPRCIQNEEATTALRAVHMKDQSDLSNGLVYWSSGWKDVAVDVK